MHTAGLEEPRLWRVAGGFMIVGLTLGAAYDFRFMRRVPRDHFTPVDRFIQSVLPLFGAAAVAGLVMGLAGVATRPFAPYLGGLLFLLLLSSLTFVRLVASERSTGGG